MLQVLWDISLLYFLGTCGWILFSLLRLPIPALLGTIAFVGFFRLSGYAIPLSPDFLSPLIQIVLGLYVGSKVTRETIRELKAMLPSVAIIVIWALSVVFVLGFILSRLTYLDPVTAILSSSMGGLPEMTVIALSTQANIAVIIIIQSIRMIVTVVAFPLILHTWMRKNGGEDYVPFAPRGRPRINFAAPLEYIHEQWGKINGSFFHVNQGWDRVSPSLLNLGRGLISLAAAAAGGILFMQLGVPAGAMVGSMFFVAIASVSGIPVVAPSSRVFGLLLVGVWLMVSDNFLPGTFVDLFSWSLFATVILSTVFIFLSSLLVSFVIHKFVGWDFPTSFLAAAPGGFTVMTTLAIKYNIDPLRISMLHLCRLLAIKSVVPFVFMFFF